MIDIRGFLRWQFSGTLRSASFWGFALAILALVAVLGGCPRPVPFVILGIGTLILLVDAVYWAVRFQYRLYQLERNNIVRELERK